MKSENKHHAKTTKSHEVSPEFVVRQLGQDVKHSILVVSLLVNAFMLIAWIVVVATSNFDGALIAYLQTK